MNSSSVPSLQSLPGYAASSTVNMQAALLAVNAAQSVQAAPVETLLQVLQTLGIGQNLDVSA